MKIAVVGAGAMGSVYAGLLADSGNQVWAIDVWQDHIDAIQKTGLRVEGASGDRVVKTVNATSNAADAKACDLCIIATKASGVAAAAKAISPHLGDQSLILTIQNGLGAGERIAAHAPADRVLLGVAEGFGASMRGPGHVHHNAMKLIRIGEMQGGLTERAENVGAVWREAGFDVKCFADIDQLIWEKFVCNCTLSAPCTAFDCTVGELRDDPARWSLALGCAREAYAVGQAKGINFSFDDPVRYVTEFAERMPHARPSMLLDHHAQRRSEIDAINGMAAQLGAEMNIPAPYNETLSTLVRHRESTFPAG